ncbi:cytochrome b/b6 domain-containing protein [Carboxylicivirga sp. A043]|uniref:cytochrome b/b6 domain-containing protein n=1 Tax=Carboxylicivirga litoralis TaxID=2816963 RepID=UPI0021CB65CB|nr:cytochrome b/b6 domain-containing protein [Carboxylicivirga sp. A043]MCU4155919.1 cytochrome b/b6 domain-containing protein [Carboxylicivirga sp. A043]
MNNVKIYSRFERFWHWTQMVLILLLMITGFEIHSTFEAFGFETSVRLHSAAGWAFLILTIFAIFWMLVTGQSKQFIPVRNNVKQQAMYYLVGIFKKAPHPVKKTVDCKLNPLQRNIYFGLIILVFPVQLITGFLYLFFHYPNKPFALEGLETVAVLHTLGAFLLVAFVIAHLYLISTGHTVTSNLQAMITGYEELDDDEKEVQVETTK